MNHSLHPRNAHEVRNEFVEELILIRRGKIAQRQTEDPEERAESAGWRAEKIKQEEA